MGPQADIGKGGLDARNSKYFEFRIAASLHRDPLDVRQHPRFGEQRLLGAIEAEQDFELSLRAKGSKGRCRISILLSLSHFPFGTGRHTRRRYGPFPPAGLNPDFSQVIA